MEVGRRRGDPVQDAGGRPSRAHMTETSNRRDQPQHIIEVPHSINMVSLLGPNDEHLSLIESGFDADVHVRGNRVTLRGESSELALAERLIDELVTILRTGQGLTPEDRKSVV